METILLLVALGIGLVILLRRTLSYQLPERTYGSVEHSQEDPSSQYEGYDDTPMSEFKKRD